MSKIIKNHKLTSSQWKILLPIYLFCFIGYFIVDITFDGIIDQNGYGGLLILLVMASGATIWYSMARSAHNYTR